MRFILIIILFLSGFFGFFRKDFKIIEATKQEWTGGLKESGKGINYRVTIVAKTNSDKLLIEGLRIYQKEYYCKKFNLSDKNAGKSFEKNDTIIIVSTTKGKNKDSSNINKQPSRDCNSEIVIDYKLKNRKKCRSVENIQILKPEYYK
jgi:hypothetical protein